MADELKTEQGFLKGIKDENLGVYSDLFSAKSGIDGQDGGMATALLISGMKKGLFDSAIVVQRTSGYNAEAVIAENIARDNCGKRNKIPQNKNHAKATGANRPREKENRHCRNTLRGQSRKKDTANPEARSSRRRNHHNRIVLP